MSAIFDNDGAFSIDILDDSDDPLKDPNEMEEMDPVLAMV
jgi:hypothetical protein